LLDLVEIGAIINNGNPPAPSMVKAIPRLRKCGSLLTVVQSNITEGGENMAKTADGKKKVYVHPHEKSDGTKVKPHYRSTPN